MAQNPSSPEGADNPRWLHSVLTRVPGINHRADVIAGNVGAGARNVVVGKNVIQIGALDISWWAVLLLLALVAGAATAAAFAVRGPTVMPGRFNVAVAAFAAEDAEGAAQKSAAGAQLSGWVFDALAQQQALYRTGGVGSTDSTTIWHDSLPWTQQGTSIGIVAGVTDADREHEAERIARKIGAQVLIYGLLRRDSTVDLRLYVSPLLGIPGASNAIAGHYDVGDPIRYSPDAGVAQATEVTARGAALFWLSAGLGFAGRGQPRQALSVLRQGEQQMQDVWSERGAGKEILYYFEGESALFQARTATDATEYEQFAADAEGYFTRALRSNPEYIRAQIGLGSLALSRAQCLLTQDPCPATASSAADSRRFAQDSIAAYEAALALAREHPDQPWASDVGPLALGMANSVLGRIDFVARQDAAAVEQLSLGLQQMRATIEPLRAEGEVRLLAQAYQAIALAERDLGDIAHDAGDTAGASGHYAAARDTLTQCIAQGSTAEASFDAFLRDALVPLCEQDMAEVDKRVRALGATP